MIDELLKIRDEIEKIEASDDVDKKRSILKIINKYGLDYIPTEKGRSLYKKLLARFYRGDRLSVMELILIDGITVYDVEENSPMIADEIANELLSKYDIDMNDNITFVPMLLHKGLIQPNPFIIPEFSNAVKKIFRETVQHEF